MITKIKEKFINHKVLIENFSSLSILQILNILIPLLTYPYLVRVLGSEYYGLIIFARAIIKYFNIIVSFGFNIIATKEISVHRNNSNKISEIVSSIFILKGSLFILSLLILSVLLYFIPQAQGYKPLFYLTMWVCFYEFIFPVFYFQGIEKMKYITYFTLVSRLIFVFLIFLLIKSKSDYLLLPVINGIGALTAGIISVIFVLKDGVKFKVQSISTLCYYIKCSYIMALANASNAFKSNFNIILIKMFFSFSMVAYFDLASKITDIGKTFLDLISRTIYPKMSREKNTSFLKKIIKLSVAASVCYVLFIQMFANQLVMFLGGEEMLPSVEILRVLIFFVPIYIIGALLGRNCLIVHGFDKYILYGMVYSSLFHLFLFGCYYLMGFDMSLIVIALILIFSFTFETTYRFIICKAKKIL